MWLTTKNTGIVSKSGGGLQYVVSLTTGSWEIARKVGNPGIYMGFRENSVIPVDLSYPKVMAKFPGTMRPHF